MGKCSPDIENLRRRWEPKIDRRPGHGPGGECHLWTAALNTGGYGQIGFDGRLVLAHRVAWFFATGEWPVLHVLHSCDTPRCVRREHLFQGTDADNSRDKLSKGRAAPVRGARHPNARLTPEQVADIRSLRGREVQQVTADRYGICQVHVSQIQLRKAWAEI